MAEKNVIEIETRVTGSGLDKYNADLEKTNKNLKKTDQGIEDLGKSQKKTGTSTRDLTNDIQKNGGAMGILNSLTGGMAQGFKDAYEAIQLSSAGLSGFKAALFATGIGAAVIVIGYLIANWKELSQWITASGRALKKYNDEQEKMKGIKQFLDLKKSASDLNLEYAKLIKDEELYQQYLKEREVINKQSAESSLISWTNATDEVKRLQEEASKQTFWESSNNFPSKITDKEREAINAQVLLADELGIAYRSASNEQFKFWNFLEEKTPEELEAIKKKEEASQKWVDNEKKRVETLISIRKKLIDSIEKLDADTEVKKLQLERDNAVKELIGLSASKEQMLETINYYNGLISNAEEAARVKELADQKKFYDDKQALLVAWEEEQEQIVINAENTRLDKLLKSMQLDAAIKDNRLGYFQEIAGATANAFDVAASFADKDQKLQKQMIIFKQSMMLIELGMEISRTISFAKEAVSRSTIALAEGMAQTAKVGFPANIPMLIGYAAQAAMIIGTLIKATQRTKGAGVGDTSGDYAGPPTYNIVGTSSVTQSSQLDLTGSVNDLNNRPVQTFITTSQVTTALALERQKNNTLNG